jgi:hypothetical protein
MLKQKGVKLTGINKPRMVWSKSPKSVVDLKKKIKLWTYIAKALLPEIGLW